MYKNVYKINMLIYTNKNPRGSYSYIILSNYSIKVVVVLF